MTDHNVSSLKGLASKMLAISREIGVIAKQGLNTHQNYHYVTEADVMAAFAPVFNQYHLFVFISIVDRQIQAHGAGWLTTVKLEVRFVDADSGEQYTSHFYGDGYDKMDKGLYKAITGALKYALLKTFMVATGDDPEKEGVAPVKDKLAPQTTADYPPPYMKVKQQAQQGMKALSETWRSLPAEEKQQLMPYAKYFKCIALQSDEKPAQFNKDFNINHFNSNHKENKS